MAVDLVNEVARLVDRRSQCEREIEDIDQRLTAVRSALGGILPNRPASHTKVSRTRYGGDTARSALLKALEKCEPLTVRHLVRETSIQSIGLAATSMWREGLLLRRLDRRGIKGGGYWYARIEQAFVGHPDCGEQTTRVAPSNGHEAVATDDEEGTGDAAEGG